MLRDDVLIIPTAIAAHSERSTRFTQTAFVCLGRNSLSGPVDTARCAKHSSVSLGIPTENSAYRHKMP